MEQDSQVTTEDIKNGPQSTMDDVPKKEVIILVVANKPGDKEFVLNSLMTGGTWKERTTLAGVRIFKCKSPALKIVDTLPLRHMRTQRSPSQVAKRWISRNGLRRIVFENDVVVVCVLPCTPFKPGKRMFSFRSHRLTWFDIFSLIFRPHSEAVTILPRLGDAKSDDFEFSNVKKFVDNHEFLRQNIIYPRMLGADCLSKTLNFAKKFSMRNEDQIWGPERVLLVGMTGNGKSTLAEMLTRGQLDPEKMTFISGPGLRGVTSTIIDGTGRGWLVVDSPGFGEAEDPRSTVPENIALEKMRTFLRLVNGVYSHYVFVTKKGRHGFVDKRLWDFFKRLLGNEAHQRFIVVVSDADDQWIEDSKEILKGLFTGCVNFFAAKFTETPAETEEEKALVGEERENMLRDRDAVRKRGKRFLRLLEENFAKLGRVEIESSIGKWSKGNIQDRQSRTHKDLSLAKKLIQRISRGSEPIFDLCAFYKLNIAKLTNVLKLDNSPTLSPVRNPSLSPEDIEIEDF